MPENYVFREAILTVAAIPASNPRYVKLVTLKKKVKGPVLKMLAAKENKKQSATREEIAKAAGVSNLPEVFE